MRTNRRPTPKLAPSGPDCPALIEVLLTLRYLPDHLGETKLNSTEAAAIRACGFEARAGWKRPWRCPLLPHALLWPYPALYHLSDGVDRLWQPTHLGWAKERARPIKQIAPLPPMDPLSSIDKRILNAVRMAGRIPKRRLQQKLWRLPAMIFNHALHRLIAGRWLALHDGCLAAQ